jgi:hypothetical protein
MHHQEATTSIEDMIQGLCLGWCCLQFICTVTYSTQTANFIMKQRSRSSSSDVHCIFVTQECIQQAWGQYGTIAVSWFLL